MRLFEYSEPNLRQGHPAFSAALRSVSCKFSSSLILILLLATVGHATESTIPSPHEYRLRFYHTHTGERLDVVYRRGDQYIPEALDELDHFLRDHRTGDVRHFDPRLFDLLHDLTASLDDSGGEIDVICGYRTPWSNEFLRTRNPHTGVAEHSLHMQAEAIDIRLPGIPTSELRDAALRLHRGGVGYYRISDFVHVDVGRVRRW
ncbi:MAG: YcbK family protein [Terriglobales bacterium]